MDRVFVGYGEGRNRRTLVSLDSLGTGRIFVDRRGNWYHKEEENGFTNYRDMTIDGTDSEHIERTREAIYALKSRERRKRNDKRLPEEERKRKENLKARIKVRVEDTIRRNPSMYTPEIEGERTGYLKLPALDKLEMD